MWGIKDQVNAAKNKDLHQLGIQKNQSNWLTPTQKAKIPQQLLQSCVYNLQLKISKTKGSCANFLRSVEYYSEPTNFTNS